ncbi:MAG: pitrilysin family protein, partial [Candidatus Omnitrophica bacterium]|nr:pitrilysin family protein [Candidatus Omnitrophota bacterium]
AEMMWPDQPLGMPLAGTVDSVRAITRSDLLTYKSAYYNPKNILVAAAGKVEEEELTGIAGKYFIDVPAGPVSQFEKVILDQKVPGLHLTTKETEQTHMALGFHAVDRFHPDKHVLSILNIILGANMSSRLFHIVRDEMALCYEISSSIRRYEDCGAFVVSAGVDNNKLARALEIILRELGRVKREAVGAEELRRAKEYYKGQLLFALEDTMSHMLWMGEKTISGEKDFSVKSILAKVDAVGSEDLMRVANDMLWEAKLNLAVIGPVKNDKDIRKVLKIS